MKKYLRSTFLFIKPFLISFIVYFTIWSAIILNESLHNFGLIILLLGYTGYYILWIDNSKSLLRNYFTPVIFWFYLVYLTFSVNKPMFELYSLPCLITVNIGFIIACFYKNKAKVASYTSFSASVIIIILYLGFIEPKREFASNEEIDTPINLKKLANGKAIFKDVNGNDVPLEKISNKVVFLEFGFSNCIPCILKEPIIKKLKNNFKENKNISFVKIIDGNIDDFKIYKASAKKYGQDFDLFLYAPKSSMDILRNALNISGYPYEKVFKNGNSILTHVGFSDIEASLYYNKRMEYLTKFLNE